MKKKKRSRLVWDEAWCFPIIFWLVHSTIFIRIQIESPNCSNFACSDARLKGTGSPDGVGAQQLCEL